MILHSLEQYAPEKKYDVLVLLEPTSPLRETSDIDAAIEKLCQTPTAESIVSVAKVESQHPDFLVEILDGKITPFTNKQFTVKRRQEIADLYFFDGSLYISKIAALKKFKTFYHEFTLAYCVPKYKSFEIDDITDFKIVEGLLDSLLEGETFGSI